MFYIERILLCLKCFIPLSSLFLILSSCRKEQDKPHTPANQPPDTSVLHLAFIKITTVPYFVGATFTDISFSDTAFGALIYKSANRIYITNDFGTTWALAPWQPPYGFPLRCLAMRKDGSEIFAGTTVGRYALLNGTGDSVLYSGEVGFYSNNQTIDYHFTSAYYNFEGGLWASTGNDLKNNGMLLLKYSTTYSIWNDISANLLTHHYISSVVRKRQGDIIVGVWGYGKGIFAKYNNASQFAFVDIATSQPYENECPLSLSLNTNEKLLAAYGGVPNNNRLYVTTYPFSLVLWRRIEPFGIVGNFRCARFDGRDYIWVCTDNGLYRSVTPVH
jgi:hypothetical protein